MSSADPFELDLAFLLAVSVSSRVLIMMFALRRLRAL